MKVKRATIDTDAYELEQHKIKQFILANDNKLSAETLIQFLNASRDRLIVFVEKEVAEPFQIPEWINQDVTVSIQAKEIG